MSFEFPLLRQIGHCLSLVALTMIGSSPTRAEVAQNPGAADWPCQQVLVPEISVPAVWSGPSIKGVEWRRDAKLADLVARLAARRTPIEEAERLIDEFATAAGPQERQKLTALFAGVYETLNAERTEVIDGLIRFGRKLKDLAAKIRSEQAKQPPPGTASSDAETRRAEEAGLAWDLRVFEERRQSIYYVCESPAIIEHRLFALARAIESRLD
jgi:hypothetical protein